MTASPHVLVTGAAGFIGSRFALDCLTRGESVIAVDDLRHCEERPLLAIPKGLQTRVRWVDRRELLAQLEGGKLPALSHIVHLGAKTDTMELNEAVHQELNLKASQDLWSWATRAQVPFVYASSAATYGDGPSYDDDESRLSRLEPLNPYGRSKHRFDLWALEQEARRSCPPHWSGFKFFNVYGYGEHYKGRMASVVWHAYQQILQTGRMKLFKSHREGIADGEQKRDFVWVGDLIRVLQFARGFEGDKGLKRGIYNLGTGKARSFLDLARAVLHACGRLGAYEEAIQFIDTPEALRARYQYFTEAKMSKLRAEGYTAPFATLEEGVAQTIAELQRATTIP